jgi:hypothetical protein
MAKGVDALIRTLNGSEIVKDQITGFRHQDEGWKSLEKGDPRWMDPHDDWMDYVPEAWFIIAGDVEYRVSQETYDEVRSSLTS